jgi:excisionase family DNA binding protein
MQTSVVPTRGRLAKMERESAEVRASLTSDPLLSTKEACAVLGCSYGTIVRWIANGHVPAQRYGGQHGHFKIRSSALRALIEARHAR